MIDELVTPVAGGVGVRLLQKMGWRQGRGVGGAAGAAAGGPGSKWGPVQGVGVENTPLYILEPKQGLHGLGFDPFRGAEEFRAAQQQRRGGGAGGRGGEGGGGGAAGPAAGGKRGRGVAFGAGVGYDDDACGVEFEDYVDEDAAALAAKGPRRLELLAYEDNSDSGARAREERRECVWGACAHGVDVWGRGRCPPAAPQPALSPRLPPALMPPS